MENAEPNEPADPIDRMDPDEPIDRIDPLDPMLRIDPAEPLETLLLPTASFLQPGPDQS